MRLSMLIILLCFAGSISLSAQRLSGIFQQSDAKFEYVEGQPWEKFEANHRRLNGQGYRLVNLETSGIGKEREFWGIYTQSAHRDTMARVLGWEEFVKMKRGMADRGYVLYLVQGYAHNETDMRFIGIWRKEKLPHKVWKLDSREGVIKKTEEMAAENFFLREVEIFHTPSGLPVYLAIYHFNPVPQRSYVFVSNNEKTFNTDWLQRYNSRMRLIDFEEFTEGGEVFYLGVYQPGEYNNLLVRDQDRMAFDGRWEQLEKEGLQLVDWEMR